MCICEYTISLISLTYCTFGNFNCLLLISLLLFFREIEVKDDSLRVVKYCDGESYKPTLSIAVLLILPSSARSTLLTELYFETLSMSLYICSPVYVYMLP